MTGQQFIDLCNGEESVIELSEDVDFNDYEFTNTIAIENKTINGNGHKISNIQNETTSVFVSLTNTVFNNAILNNMYIPRGSFCGKGEFNECSITGVINTVSSNTTVFNKCSINIERASQLRYCNCTDCYIVMTEVYDPSNANIFWGTHNGCYLKGSITLNGATSYTLNMNLSNSCFNIDITADANISISGTDGAMISVLNTTKISSNVSFGKLNKVIGVTDDEMHNAQALFDKGFSIYVP